MYSYYFLSLVITFKLLLRIFLKFSSTDFVAVLLGNGNGTFSIQQSYATGDNSFDVITTNFDTDGNLDLVVKREIIDSMLYFILSIL